MFDIVISFLNIQKEQIKTVIYDIKFSFNIILLIFILLEKSSDNDINKIKEIIYNNYISNIVNLSKSPLIKCKRLLQFANEFILILKQEDNNFVSKIKEEMIKEILKYDVLNRPFLSKNYIFIVFKDIINILIRKDENYESFFELFKSIINIISDKKIIFFTFYMRI